MDRRYSFVSDLFKDFLTNGENEEITIAQRIEHAFDLLTNSRDTSKKSECIDELKFVAEYLKVDELSAAFFSLIFGYNFLQRENPSLYFLAEILGFSSVDILKYTSVIKGLVKKHLCTEIKPRHFVEEKDDFDKEYRVSLSVRNSIIENKPLKVEEKKFNLISFLSEANDCLGSPLSPESFRRSIRSRQSNLDSLGEKEEFFSEDKRISELQETVPFEKDRYLFYLLCFVYLNDGDISLETALDSICISKIEMSKYAEELISKKNVLVSKNLIEIMGEGNPDYISVSVTEEGLRSFLGEDFDNLSKQKVKDKNLIYPEDIKSKNLFFDKKTKEQVDVLQNILYEEKYSNLMSRLKSKGMKTGIAVLLYGKPGTGKTESVYQLCRESNRPIFHVDISSTKSCYFGESQKLIKRLFNRYNKYCRNARSHHTPLPVLLLNEADGIISKRKDVGMGNLAQEENAIQNVILEEMENLEGILIATTNLADNLDKAFERRFLFKVEFEQPSWEVRTKIWQSKLPFLSADDSEILAENFDFSGGEIDNIARKLEIESILRDDVENLDFVMDLCNNERIIQENCTNSIGFSID